MRAKVNSYKAEFHTISLWTRILKSLCYKMSLRKPLVLTGRHNAIIAIGNLNGVRKNNKGRKMNRKVNSMPFYRLKEYIKYKALERGILVIEVPEYNTSRQCSRCGSMNTERPSQGIFICKDCGYQVNADINGAKNILKRAMGYMLMAGAVVTQPEGKRFILNHIPQPPLTGLHGGSPRL